MGSFVRKSPPLLAKALEFGFYKEASPFAQIGWRDMTSYFIILGGMRKIHNNLYGKATLKMLESHRRRHLRCKKKQTRLSLKMTSSASIMRVGVVENSCIIEIILELRNGMLGRLMLD